MRRLLLGAIVAACALAASSAEWKSRTIYQILTDRFATTNGTSPYCDKHKYCGGTWEGIIKKLDYIEGMGFDAIWLSPTLHNSEGGYHGYWIDNWFAPNENFGTEETLARLADAAHERGMYVMVDVIANHVGAGSVTPFNANEHYHDCNGCPGTCNIEDWQNQPQVEHCRLSGLRDLNQDGNQWVKDQLIKSAAYVVNSSGADGLRLDTVPEVSKAFWSEYRQKLGLFMTGEVFDGRMDYSAGYQQVLDSVLGYPMYFALRNAFASSGSLYSLGDTWRSARSSYKDLNAVGTFVDNHDNPRFLNARGDTWAYKNALVYALMGQGIPMIYYGTEQAYKGGADPENREPLWESGYKTDTDMYQFLKTTIAARKQFEVWKSDQEERYRDQQFYAFTRGNVLVALTNVGGSGSDVVRSITYHPFKDGQKLCNIYWPKDDCVVVQGGKIDLKLMHGEPKVYYLA